jgi:2-dehydropantoate 2-reductase
MRIAVVGAGGVGGYFGGRLAQAGHEVHFIARGAHLAAIRERGLRVESIKGDFAVHPALATDQTASVGTVDTVIVSVKTWQLGTAAKAAQALVGPETVVLPLLNGVDASNELADALGPGHVLGGVCRITAEIAAPGLIRHSAVEPSIVLGERDNEVTARVQDLVAALTRAGIRTDIAPDIDAAIWEKFMLIVTWSGIGAVTRAPIGVWRALPGLRSMAESGLREVVEVARERHVSLADDRVTATLEAFDGVHPDSMASMQRDILNGRPSELEAQNGAVVRLGRATGVATPTHSFIYHSLVPQENAARSLSSRAT